MSANKERKLADVAPASTEAILESISEGVFTVDRNWRITSFNRAAEVITGISREEAYGRFCSEVFRSNMCETDCALRKTLKTGRPVIGKTGYIVDDNGDRTSAFRRRSCATPQARSWAAPRHSVT